MGLRLLPLVVGGAAACIGQIGDDGALDVSGPPADTLVCDDAIRPGPAPIRRMTRFEYNATVRDLLGDTTGPADDFGAEEEALGFNNNAANLVTSSTLAEKYMNAAEGIAERATENLSGLLPCDPAETGEDACALAFIYAFGKRAFRRPLEPGEREMFVALFEAGRADGGFRTGIELVLQAALQSPPFLYRVELGVPAEAGASVVRLTSWEMASRLSYLFWGSMPDDELFTAAETGSLATKEQVAAQARRLLADSRARVAVGNFHAQWLDYDRVAGAGKAASLFPDWSPAIGELMREESARFLDYAVFEGDGDLTTLLTAPYSFMNRDLATFYGVDGPEGDAFEKVSLDASKRAGLLTLGALLAVNAHSNQTSPVHRGKLVREQLLCQHMPPPPADVTIKVPEPAGDTARERFAQHSSDPACSGCHTLMDPIGFGFESYDAVGRYRELERGAPVDATGTLSKTDVDGAFDGPASLGYRLASSEQVKACYVTQWFRFAYGRGETRDDDCTRASLQAAFDAGSGDVEDLLVALTQTDAFLYRKAGGAP